MGETYPHDICARVPAQPRRYIPIRVHLALKGFELCLCKITLHDMDGKVFGLMHLEGSSSMLPGNDMVKALSVGIVEKFIESTRKGLG